MSDDIDRANDRAEIELARAIEARRLAAEKQKAEPHPTECINGCGEAIVAPARFCSSDCQSDFSERAARLRRLGVK